jgi:hypothetical protein
MKKQAPLLLILVFVITSCSSVNFLYPISEEKNDRIFKKELMGVWRSGDSDDKVKIIIDTTIDIDSSLVYSLKIFDQSNPGFGDTSYLAGQLFNLQSKFFMVTSTDMEHEMKRGIGFYNAAMTIPSYQVFRIYKITRDSIQIGQLNGDTLIHLIKTKKMSLKNEMIEKSDILILERSLMLQKKLIELEKFQNVYDKETLYRAK